MFLIFTICYVPPKDALVGTIGYVSIYTLKAHISNCDHGMSNTVAKNSDDCAMHRFYHGI